MLKTILVALDCSDISDKVIAALENLNINPKTQIILSHVLPDLNTDEELIADRPVQSRDILYQQIEQQLQAYQMAIPGSSIEISTGDAVEEIIRLANIHQVELIVIGTRDIKGLKRVIEGSVSGQVVADAPCSVFVVKPTENS